MTKIIASYNMKGVSVHISMDFLAISHVSNITIEVNSYNTFTFIFTNGTVHKYTHTNTHTRAHAYTHNYMIHNYKCILTQFSPC